MYAQHLLAKHVPRIKICRFKGCGKCVEHAFGPRPDAFAELEVSARNAHGKLIRSDVAVYVVSPGGELQKIVTLEVRKTHATDPASRAGDVPYFEVNAEHVIGALDGAGERSTVTLKCENAATPCELCAIQQRDRKRPHAGASAATRPEVAAPVDFSPGVVTIMSAASLSGSLSKPTRSASGAMSGIHAPPTSCYSSAEALERPRFHSALVVLCALSQKPR